MKNKSASKGRLQKRLKEIGPNANKRFSIMVETIGTRLLQYVLFIEGKYINTFTSYTLAAKAKEAFMFSSA